jgi:hypothetical protein
MPPTRDVRQAPAPYTATRPNAVRAARPGRRYPTRRGLQICLGLLWLLDAALQYQPFMFRPAFVPSVIEPAIAGNPSGIAASVTWASHLMAGHIAVFNTAFATTQLVIALGILYRRTAKRALAASVCWAVSVWWFGEALGGVFTGASPLAGLPGAALLYALIATILWPPRSTAAETGPDSVAAAGRLGPALASLLWLTLWASVACYCLLPANRAPGAVARIFAGNASEPGWLASVLSFVARVAHGRGTAISIGLAVACAAVAFGIFGRRTTRPALVLAAAVGLLCWLAEGLGAIFTGMGTDPGTGPLIVLLAACYWPRTAGGRVSRPPRSGRAWRPWSPPRRASARAAWPVPPTRDGPRS